MGLPALAGVALAATAAAWLWPVGARTAPAPAPAAGVDVEPERASADGVEAVRIPLAAPVREESASRTAPRREANDAAGAPLLDERERARESEHYARFLALDAQGLEAQAARVLEGPGPDCEKVALLRALESSGSPRLHSWLEHALLRLPDVSGPAGDSVPGFALARLARSAAHDASARSALERVAFGAPRAPERLRRLAVTAWACSATEDELWRLASHLSYEQDALVKASAAEALSRNRSPAAVAAVFGPGHDVARPESADTTQE
jgi:hypothetical protein